jgi:hypothetical protein
VRYENLLTRSFQILRRKLWLWPLAFLAGLTSSGGGGGGGGTSFQARSNSAPPDVSWVPNWFADRIGLIIEIGIAILLLELIWFLVSCVASGALIGAVARIDAGEPIRFGEAWRLGTATFGRVLLFKLLVLLLVLLPALLLALPPILGLLAGQRGLLAGLFLDLPLSAAYLFWVLFVAWLGELAIRACVLEGLGPGASFAAAWALLKRRFHRVAMTTVVYIGAGIGIGILTGVIYGFVQAPLTAAVTTDATQGRWADAIGTLLTWSLFLLPVSLAVSSAVGAYFAIFWTLAFRRFDAEDEKAEPPQLAA